jgi:cytochrome P450
MRYPPGPRGREVLGFFGRGSAQGTILFLEQTARRYGPLSYFRILNQRIYLVDDADLINEILVTRQHSFVRDNGATVLRELVGDGLLTRDEPRHRERRRILQPAFHRAQIESYAEFMISESERFSRELREGEPVNINQAMKQLTLSIVGSALFGSDFRESATRVAEVIQRVIRRFTWIGPTSALIEPVIVLYRRAFPRGPSLFFHAERKELERIVEPILRERRTAQRRDMLSLLLGERDDSDRPLSDEDVRNEIITLVLAGHETTATALTWTWYLLARHPEIEKKLHAELDAVIGDRDVTFDDLSRLTYTSTVFKEAMRLYPPAMAFGRRPNTTVELGGYTIPKGSTIMLSPYITQRNGRYYPEPLQFRPERWVDFSAPKMAYFPFGAGAKMCIGEGFARMEGALVLAMLARAWRFRPITDQVSGIGPGLVLRPDRPILLKPFRRVREREEVTTVLSTGSSGTT